MLDTRDNRHNCVQILARSKILDVLDTGENRHNYVQTLVRSKCLDVFDTTGSENRHNCVQILAHSKYFLRREYSHNCRSVFGDRVVQNVLMISMDGQNIVTIV